MEIEKISKKDFEGYEFPLDKVEIDDALKKLPSEDIEGLEKIIITPPIKNEDFKRFARYEKGKIYLFAHQKVNGKFVIEQGDKGTVEFIPEEFRNRAYQAILHETGHHIGIRDFNDYSETFANDYQSENFIKYFSHLLK